MKTVNLLTIDLQLRSRGIKQLPSLSLKKCYLLFKTSFKIFSWWLILARFKDVQFFTI